MEKSRHVWLDSYPRSGNTLLRTILRHCFTLWSASICPNDLGGNRKLEDYAGHSEQSADGKVEFPAQDPALIKTHEYPADNNSAIYIVRNGRADSVSLWEFYNRSVPLTTIIAGQHRFGTWSDHLAT